MKTSFLLLIISALIILNILSCNTFTEPEPFVNNSAHPMQVIDTTIAVLSNYSEGQEVIGDITPIFIPDINSSEIHFIRVYVDSTFIGTIYNSPYTIKIDTRLWPNGKHDINFHVFKSKAGDSLGVLGLFQDYERVYKTHLNFTGKSLMLGNDIVGIYEDVEDRVIFLHDPYVSDATIISISTETCSILNSNKLLFNDLVAASRSLDQKRLFLLMGYSTIYVLNSGTFAREDLYGLATSRYDFVSLAVGTDDRLYCSLKGGELYIFHHGLANSYHFNRTARFLSISPDGSTMLAVNNNGITSYLLQGNSVTFSSQSTISDTIDLFRVDWNNSRIFIARQSNIAEVWDVQNLTSIGYFQLSTSSGSVEDITAITANSEFLYVANTLQQNNTLSSIIVEYDITTQEQKRSWTFPFIIQYLMGSEKGRYLFACTSTDQWVIDKGETF